MANHSIADVLVSLKRNNISYNLTNKVVFTPLGQPIGIHLLGKIDFLVNHHGWHCEKVMSSNEPKKVKKAKKKFNREDKKEANNIRSHKAHNEQKGKDGVAPKPKPKTKRSNNSKPKAKATKVAE